MKKLYFAAAALAALSFASCSQQLETEPAEATTFEITVNAPTKTVVDDEWNVTWETTDAIQAVINSNGAKFTNNGGNRFVTTDFAPEDGTEYTWNLLYHADAAQYFTTSNGVDTDGYTKGYFALPATAVQAKAGDKSHLGGQPLYGYATTTGTESPAANMNHLTTVIVVKVTNSTSESIDITDIIAENDSDAAMSGTFFINCAEGKVKSKTPAASVSMSVTDGTIAAGETAEFYIPAAPFAIAEGKNITITLKSGDKKAEFVKNIPAGKTFAAGKFNSTSVTVSADTFEDATIQKLTVAEFLAKEVSSTTWYQLTGIVTNLATGKYGNFDLKDETGTVYIYGLTQTQVAKNDQSFPNLGVKEGDEVTIITLRAEYKGTAQGGGTPPAYYVSHRSCKAFAATLDKASVTAEAGTATIKITADDDVNWTITNDNEAVFTLAETSGTGSKDITVTYTANESTTDSRVANFVVSTSDFVATSSYNLKLNQTAAGDTPVETNTVTIDFSTFGFTDKSEITVPYTNKDIAPFTVSMTKGTSNAPAWYSPFVRFYTGSTLKLESEKTITKMVITAKSSNANKPTVTVDNGTYTYNATTTSKETEWSGEANSVTFKMAGSKNYQISKIVVTYIE